MKMPPELYLEGGDVIPFCYDNKKVLLIGYGPRTSLESLYFLRQTLVKERMVDEIIGFKLADWRLNIDGCFSPFRVTSQYPIVRVFLAESFSVRIIVRKLIPWHFSRCSGSRLSKLRGTSPTICRLAILFVSAPTGL
jgi:N-dimethylarginine dimethylaminohydrolase